VGSKDKEYRNPIPTVDVIIPRGREILMVRRKKDPFKGRLALPGGFIDWGEPAEKAAVREAKEETSLVVEPVDILGVYSDPKRDPRGHMMTTVFVTVVIGGEEKAGDDSAGLEWVSLDILEEKKKAKFAFDHAKILSDYIMWKKTGTTSWSFKER
jgi:8-oxo-dGTP diphosphatase